jgi:hypothetical protein
MHTIRVLLFGMYGVAIWGHPRRRAGPVCRPSVERERAASGARILAFAIYLSLRRDYRLGPKFSQTGA